ncbi:Transposon Ty3-G Gag-Pol polyprotein [Labeo rohita]|uniref:Transposon Ty3-G Gag-Pol polyprotein n=1 Tax=Labeo rohita TaxID=84645 RepID=A0ABQ8MSL3_LABRO|nr:Transposon Ty3-G Gag-Pol polyprotein [Labeo rohita]
METALTLFHNVFRIYGLPEDIAKRQVERLNQEIGRYLRIYCNREQHRWSEFLPWAEYAQNSLTHSSTGPTPFQCVLGFQPPMLYRHASRGSPHPMELNVLGLPQEVDAAVGSVGRRTPVRSENGSEEELMSAVEVEADVRARLPPFESFSPMSTGSKGETRLKVHLAHLQMEVQEKAQVQQAEMDLRLQIRKLEIEAEKQVKMQQLELDTVRIVGGTAAQPDLPRVTTAAAVISTPLVSSPPVPPVSAPSVATESFDVSKHITLVPLFRQTEIDSYFSAFERIATSLHWPKELWALLLQCRLVGKVLEVFSSLSVEDSFNYETVKLAILCAYELVPEAYRQKFRGHKKNLCQTFVEFAREKFLLFDKWCSATKTKDFDSLRELILLEEFKWCLPERVVVYLNEQKVNSLSQAAVLADEFMLTHKGVFSVTRTEKSVTSGISQSQSARVKIV